MISEDERKMTDQLSKPVNFAEEVLDAIKRRQRVVALESTVIAHGLPWPLNLETAQALEAVVRAEGAIPATIAVWQGRPTIGLTGDQLEGLARGADVVKASTRDLGWVVAQRRTAATTVAATIALAHPSVRILATGGIGGAHRDTGQPWDISADLFEMAFMPVAVVCAGAKSVLDIPRTLEMLESYSVPVIGYATDTFPAFYLRSSGQPVTARVDDPGAAAALLKAHWQFGAGVVIAQPIAEDVALAESELHEALVRVEAEAVAAGIRGKDLTPFLLAGLARLTGGKSLRANQALLIANARLAAQIPL